MGIILYHKQLQVARTLVTWMYWAALSCSSIRFNLVQYTQHRSKVIMTGHHGWLLRQIGMTRLTMLPCNHPCLLVVAPCTLQSFLLVRQFRPPVYMSRVREATAAGLPQPCRSTGECGG